MSFSGLKIGFCICGSFCTFDQVIPELKKLVAKGADVTPIFQKQHIVGILNFIQQKNSDL